MFDSRWSKKYIIYLPLIIALIFTVFSCTTRVDVFELISQQPNIKVSYEEYEIQNRSGNYSFGQTEISNKKDQIFIISNVGELTLTIKGISFSGDYDQFFINDSSMETVLEPGEKTQITVSFVPTKTGTFKLQLILESDDPDDELFTFNLTGEGIEGTQTKNEPDLKVYINNTPIYDQSSVNLGNTYIGSSKSVEFLIKNEGENTLYINYIGYSGHLSQFNRSEPEIPVMLEKSDYTTLRIIFHPDSPGSFELVVSLVTNDPDIKDFTINVIGSGSITPEPDISVSTGGIEIISEVSSYDFGYTQVTMQPEPVTFTIENTGNADLEIYTIGITGVDSSEFIMDTQNLQSPIAPGNSSTFDITFDPESEGDKTAIVSIVTNDPDSPEQTFTFEITGTGTSSAIPDIKVSIGSIAISSGSIGYDFGKVTIGQSTPSAQFNIKNVGTDTLNIQNISLLGGNSDQFILESNTFPFTIEPSNSSTLTITYNPASKGKHSAEVSIESNDPDTDPFTFIINAEATDKDAPNMQVYIDDEPYFDGSNYYFGEVKLDDNTDPVIFTIKNEGSANLKITGYKKRGGNTKDFDVNFPHTPFNIQPAGQEEFSVIFSPSKTGVRSTRLEISTNAGKYNILLEGRGED